MCNLVLRLFDTEVLCLEFMLWEKTWNEILWDLVIYGMCFLHDCEQHKTGNFDDILEDFKRQIWRPKVK